MHFSLPHPSEIKIDLERNSKDHILHGAANTDVQVVVDSLELKVLSYTLNDKLYREVQERLNKESLRYYFQQPCIDTYSLGTGNPRPIIDNIGVGKIPSAVYIFVQETSRYDGQLNKNSLRFPRQFGSGATAAGVVSCKMTIGNNCIDGLYNETPDSKLSMEYFKYFLLNNMLTGGESLPPHIDPEEFCTDFSFWYFDLTT